MTNNTTSFSFSFAQFDPRPQGAEKNEAVFAAGPVYGIEVTIAPLAARCIANLDHHGPNNTAETPSAAEQAMTAELPLKGTTLATVRCDTDSVSAMAILASRAVDRKVDEELVKAIGAFDRLGPSAGRPCDEIVAISRVAADLKRPLAERVSWVQNLLAGEGDTEEVAELVAARDKEFAAARKASELSLHAEDRIACVVSTHRFATQLGYEAASVLVCFNAKMPVNFREPDAGTYKKFTICRYDSHVPCDLTAAMVELNELDPAVSGGSRWGGRPDVGGSPQGVSSGLTPEEVVEVVARHLK